jgi:hypothetical protein
VLEIERVRRSWRRYTVRDERIVHGVWTYRGFGGSVEGDLDGQRYQIRRRRGKGFELIGPGAVLATGSSRRGGRWSIAVDEARYELRRRSARHAAMEVWQGFSVVGSVRKQGMGRGIVRCELPAELAVPVQAFIGFVAVAIWSRARGDVGTIAIGASG